MKTWRIVPVALALVMAAGACGGGTTTVGNTEDTGGGGSTDDVSVSDSAGDSLGDAGNDTAAQDVPKDVPKDVASGCSSNAQCNDNDVCTDDKCEADGKCSHVQNGKPCDDGDACTTGDHCQAGACLGTGECQDVVQDVPDTQSGDTGGDTSADVVQTTNCSKAEWDSMQNEGFITQASTCGQGCATNPAMAQCVSDCLKAAFNLSDTCATCYTGLASCVSGKCLTDCALDANSKGCKDCAAVNCGNALGTCSGFPAPNCGDDGDCNDGSVCTTDKCVNMFCVYTPIPCDDGNLCTADACDPKTGCGATALPASVTCDDANACTEGDNCGTGNCAGTAKVCNDNNPCTDDSCTLAGDCTTTNNTAACSDGVDCTENDTCSGGACAGLPNDATCADADPCTQNTCSVSAGCLSAPVTGTTCDDGNACTGEDTCTSDGCAGTAKVCNDQNPCTDDSCTLAGDCTFTANTATCNDAVDCTNDDACAGGTCAGLPNHATCADGNSCTDDVCDTTAGCVNNDLSDVSCNDGVAGTINDTCTVGVCAGELVECVGDDTCADDLSCTTDKCDLGTHKCTNTQVADTCLIDGGCHLAGDASATACQGCDPGKSATSWSAVNESKVCNSNGICASGECVGNWPPSLASLSSGKSCTLPTCNTDAALPFSSSGNWIVSTKTVSTTCGTIVGLVEPQANVGYIKTGKAHGLNFVGACDYAPGGTTLQIGTFVSNTEATCEVKSQGYGVTSVEVSQVAFAGGIGTGNGQATLFDLPTIAGEPDNSCVIVVEVTVTHIPDCATATDCDDDIACTTDACDLVSGACTHTIADNMCLIDGACIGGGEYQSTTGDGSCRFCGGTFPSQGGWVVLSSGEPCESGQGTCGPGGVCSVPK